MDAREGGRPLELPRVNGERVRAANKERRMAVMGMGSPEQAHTHAQGTFTYDVHTEGEGGLTKT